MEPVMAQLENEYGDRVDFPAYDTTKERGKANTYGIAAVPTIIFLDADGKVVSKVVGYQSLDIMRGKVQALLSSSS
jgi:thiol-disulfide isomerase/thioredoxin